MRGDFKSFLTEIVLKMVAPFQMSLSNLYKNLKVIFIIVILKYPRCSYLLVWFIVMYSGPRLLALPVVYAESFSSDESSSSGSSGSESDNEEHPDYVYEAIMMCYNGIASVAGLLVSDDSDNITRDDTNNQSTMSEMSTSLETSEEALETGNILHFIVNNIKSLARTINNYFTYPETDSESESSSPELSPETTLRVVNTLIPVNVDGSTPQTESNINTHPVNTPAIDPQMEVRLDYVDRILISIIKQINAAPQDSVTDVSIKNFTYLAIVNDNMDWIAKTEADVRNDSFEGNVLVNVIQNIVGQPRPELDSCERRILLHMSTCISLLSAASALHTPPQIYYNTAAGIRLYDETLHGYDVNI